MKTSVLFASALFGALAAASPVEIQPRQSSRVGSTANEFVNGGCAPVIMFFARGSTEAGNMGTVCGPPTAQGLKDNFGAANVAVQGVDYSASLATNFAVGGADKNGIAEMKSLIAQATTECPDSKLVVGGYSQGAALTHRAVEDLPAAQMNQITAAFLFGDTQFQQSGGRIANYPPEQTKIICNTGDLVCQGTLTIAAPHLLYGARAPEMVEFLTQQLTAAGVPLAKK